MNIQSEA